MAITSAGTLPSKVPSGARRAAARLHEGIEAVVVGLEGAGLDLGDGRVERRLEMPERRGDHRVGIVGLRVDDVADRQNALLLGRIGNAEALGIEQVGAGIDLGEGGFLGLGRIEPRADEGDLELGVRRAFPSRPP